MLALLLFLTSLVIAGAAATGWLWSRGESLLEEDGGGLGALEALASAMLVTTFLWVAINWCLSPFHAIGLRGLLGVSIALAVPALLYGRDQRRAAPDARSPFFRAFSNNVRLSWVVALAVSTPLVLWLVFLSWRGTVTLALSHDALSYHLPRAVDLVRTGGWRYLDVEDFRLAWFPADYEMMLADIIALTGTDRAIWILALFHYLSGFLICAAWGERRWGSSASAWVAAVLWAGTPLALLHSGGQKNDVLMMVLTVSVALWGARWVVRGGVAPLVLTLIACTLGLGTKATGAFAAPAMLLVLLPFGLLRRLRRTISTPKQLAMLLVGSVAALLLSGVFPLVSHLLHPRSPLDLGMTAAEMAQINITPTYDGWSNLWRFPALLWLRAFTDYYFVVPVPWLHQRWFWPKYELYFSDFGVALSLLALLVPTGLLFASRRPKAVGTEQAKRSEHKAASLYLLVTAAMIIVIRYRIDGGFNSYPRYVLFLPLLVADAGILNLLDGFRLARAPTLPVTLTLLVLAGVFVKQGVRIGRDDNFATAGYLMYLLDHPDSRVLSFGGPPRAAQLVDQQAGPHERILVDGDFGAWIYPAYGRDLTRPVEILPLRSEARARAVDSADWIVIDHFWSICWGAPDFTDMGKAMQLFDHGHWLPSDGALYESLMNDPRFELAGSNLPRGQALFRRVSAARPL